MFRVLNTTMRCCARTDRRVPHVHRRHNRRATGVLLVGRILPAQLSPRWGWVLRRHFCADHELAHASHAQICQGAANVRGISLREPRRAFCSAELHRLRDANGLGLGQSLLRELCMREAKRGARGPVWRSSSAGVCSERFYFLATKPAMPCTGSALGPPQRSPHRSVRCR